MSEPEEKRSHVLLEWAYRWKCPSCNHKQYASTVPCEFTENEIREICGLESWHPLTEEHIQDSSSFISPSRVQCKSCKEKFYAIPPDDVFDALGVEGDDPGGEGRDNTDGEE